MREIFRTGNWLAISILLVGMGACSESAPTGSDSDADSGGTPEGGDVAELDVITGGDTGAADALGTDVIIVPAELCQPCATDEDCEGEGARCIPSATEGIGYCGSACNPGKTDCPDGYGCESVSFADGSEAGQCRPESGECACQEGATVSCSADNEEGSCAGVRTCDASGAWGDCDAPFATAEVCNDEDDDCDGDIDEDEVCTEPLCDVDDPLACDDGLDCTEDLCDPEEGCSHSPDDAACDDGFDCTIDICDPVSDCATVADDSVCDDGDVCAGEMCDYDAGCVPDGTVLDCDDENACTEDTCDPIDGCQWSPLLCDDGILCTLDGCDPVLGCTLTPEDIFCEGATDCVALSCDALEGCLPEDVVCDDAIACTTDSCVEGSGCVYAPDATTCDDGDPCTVDVCDAGCVHNPVSCDDGVDCTNDACQADGSCVSTPDEALCDDGQECTADACDATSDCQYVPDSSLCEDGVDCTVGSCSTVAGCIFVEVPDLCDDSNVCTSDTCDALAGCSHAPVVVPCDDGSACTNSDACNDGTCAGAPITCDEDGNICTAAGCDPNTGCVQNPAPGGCDDGDLCTENDACAGGGCAGSPVVCADDGNPCSTNLCNGATGTCEGNVLEDGTSCSDGEICTVNDVCTTGSCGGEPYALCAETENVICVFSGLPGEEVMCPIQMARTLTDDPPPVGVQLILSYSGDVALTTFSDGQFCIPNVGCIPWYIPSLYGTLQEGHTIALAPPQLAQWAGVGTLIALANSVPEPAMTDAVYLPEGLEGDPNVIFAHFTIGEGADPNGEIVLVSIPDILISTTNAQPLQWTFMDGIFVTYPYPVTCPTGGQPCDDQDVCTSGDFCIAGVCVGDPIDGCEE